MPSDIDHAKFADDLRRRVAESGVADAALRRAALRAGAGEEVDEGTSHGLLARTIGEASYRVTDEMVADVRAATGSDKAAFEVVMSAGIGAGLRRWDAALAAIRDADDATR
ncbi:hypothetical protein [Microbacterium sp. H1-D42]|uniref:hypothetical protein n=1 Tax=Microbacterium sp. H1-D42 TaxID=2925844 RepID=UPI001F531CF1|nr:hypothetical protein [Microbacterium sp. H1-D42]UNK70929.1 hypothetical protein MNR00_00350 [Microbacterium sp. H1-D42]